MRILPAACAYHNLAYLTHHSKPPNFYGYLINQDKAPTPILDALLRAIANHIFQATTDIPRQQKIAEIGDKNVQALTPQKLAAFYKAVGGNYDALFIEMPYPAISYIWQVTGCQHSLQPSENDFDAPSVPALTKRGFVRWEIIEILLDPEEHVPFIQNAVKNWNLKHPVTNEPFPKDLPDDAFPAQPDPGISEWHKKCAEKLRKAATPNPDSTAPKPAAAAAAAGAPPSNWPPERDEPRVKAAYVHVRNPYPKASPPPRAPQTEYFPPSTRPVAYSHPDLPSKNGTEVRIRIHRMIAAAEASPTIHLPRVIPSQHFRSPERSTLPSQP
ncbi:hypothetical protein K4K58_005599 [Colletotrichum sp. SAR11_239]|nr:hypothetical protein K4K58_005599 [Colletotrichum sp. SAR11_239]